MSDTDFGATLAGLSPSEALDRCTAHAEIVRAEAAVLLTRLAATPRGDKAGAQVIKQAIATNQSQAKALRLMIHHYRAQAERIESHCLWADGVRSVCGQDKLTEVYAWMKAERKRRAAPLEAP